MKHISFFKNTPTVLNILGIASLGSLALFAIAPGKALADATPSNTIIVTHSTTPHATIKPSENNTFTATFTNQGSQPQTAVLDVETYRQGSDGNQTKVKQNFFEMTLGPNESRTLDVTVDVNSPVGTYVLKGGVFSPHWTNNLAWSDFLQKVEVVGVNQSGPGDNNVMLASSSETFTQVKIASQPNTFTGAFTSPNTANTVLIDIEVYNESNERVFQTFFDNVSFVKGETKNISATIPIVYTQTTYHWSVGVFTPSWKQLVHWYNSPQSFVATIDSSNTNPHISIVDFGLPKQNIPQGQGFTISPRLISAGGASTNLYIVVAVTNTATGLRQQMIYFNQTLPSDIPTVFQLTASSSLPVGDYDATAQVFHDFLGNVKNSVNFHLGTVAVR